MVERDADDSRIDIDCTLSERDADARLDWVEDTLLPHLRRIEERADGFTFVFDRTPEAYTAVTEMAWKESQCCSWATFTVELPPGDGPIQWHERSDSEAGTELFGDRLRELHQEYDDVPPIQSRG